MTITQSLGFIVTLLFGGIYLTHRIVRPPGSRVLVTNSEGYFIQEHDWRTFYAYICVLGAALLMMLHVWTNQVHIAGMISLFVCRGFWSINVSKARQLTRK